MGDVLSAQPSSTIDTLNCWMCIFLLLLPSLPSLVLIFVICFIWGIVWTILFLHLIAGQPLSVDYIFRYQEVNVKDISGRLVITCYLMNALMCSAVLWCIVQRTKLCLDFSVTAHLLHFTLSLLYNSTWPSSASWWILQFSCGTITCVLGEFLCLRTELKSIPLGLTSRVDL